MLDEKLVEGDPVYVDESGYLYKNTQKKQYWRCGKCKRFVRQYSNLSSCCNTQSDAPIIQIAIGRVVKVDNNGNGWVEINV